MDIKTPLGDHDQMQFESHRTIINKATKPAQPASPSAPRSKKKGRRWGGGEEGKQKRREEKCTSCLVCHVCIHACTDSRTYGQKMHDELSFVLLFHLNSTSKKERGGELR